MAPLALHLGARPRARAGSARPLPALCADRHPVAPRARALAQHGRSARARCAAGGGAAGRRALEVPRRTPTATSPPRSPAPAPPIGLVAHLDTSPDAPGAGVKPLVHRGYAGGVIELPRAGTRLDPRVDARAPRQDRATTSSPPAATRCSAPTTRPVWRSSWRQWHGSPCRPGAAPAQRCGSASPPTRRSERAPPCSTSIGFGARCAYTIDGSEARRDPGRDLQRGGGDRHRRRSRGSSRAGDGQAGQRAASRCPDRQRATCRADPRADVGREGFIHPYELTGTARASAAAGDHPRFRRRPAGRAR